MASGWGLRGGVSRCYPFFAMYMNCIQESKSEEKPVECIPYGEDYMECLHSRKEWTHVEAVVKQNELNLKNAKAGGGGGGGH
mmetsp:Transcript_44062/g.65356  ORF Transcript_44062/g.65356 Transcript_44062/m.65356 type:complete len:82 (-) Transcript_44062:179-424(-)|eukprot:CAMPEP_0194025820 /NCGR_PEP_ID=MMETSP0009_2-20130614/87_1 /TAXON_ID=210454 /ORGANISM="Grammatophora oceanica, Strain CCMP 410" /LENGTH=81 /DNA_ID=CAMNT_0038664149 /DNA_START=48 /DNA_END=293 /DNA_ORIENTATION=+